ncbi:MAG: redox-regulated ATPase YchF [Candidatus Bathyarchaeota archaeon]|nr:redox-regulated ATPase YchF [Candidatus Bathyarchaeota archaeon]
MVGLVGKANVGKSTFFGAATLKPVEIAGFPFTTTKADRGIGYIRAPCVCKELGVEDDPQNSACVDGVRLIPVDLIDTPGLIPGAHQGKGLGNQFLDEVRRADALIVVADASGATDLNGQPVDPLSNDPIEDVKMFEAEFDLWLRALLKKDWNRITRTADSKKESIDRHLEEKLTGLGINRYQILKAIQNAEVDGFKSARWTEEEFNRFATSLRKVSKPLIVAANKADRDGAEDNIERMKEAGYMVVPTCAEAELALRRAAEAGLVEYTPGDSDFTVKNPEKLTDRQRRALDRIKEKVFQKWGGTGLQDAVNQAFFDLLNMITVYPVEDSEKLSNHHGHVLPDCFLVPKGTTSKQFAAVIHTDLAESFIYAVNARSKRRLSDSYILENNDIIQIVSAKGRR